MTEIKTRVITGKVTAKRADKTITVSIERRLKHPLYGKTIKRRTKLLVHDEQNNAGLDDIVQIQQVCPISKNKSWKLVNVLSGVNS